MSRACSCGLVMFGVFLATPAARAGHFAIDLKVQAGKESQTAHAQTDPPEARPKPRPVLRTQAGEQVKLRWLLRSTDARATVKNVLVHFSIAREERAGQAAVPQGDNNVVAESALTMDFPPGETAEAELQLAIVRAGSYLVRLETIGATGQSGHEHSAALNLVVREVVPSSREAR